MVKIRKTIVAVIVVCIALSVLLYIRFHGSAECPFDGPNSSAPLNLVQFNADVEVAVHYLTTQTIDTVVCTSINAEAAKYNLVPFLESVSAISPPLSNRLIIFCLDKKAMNACNEKHNPRQCIYMDLGISGDSLAPGGNDKSDNDYWRLTFGRVYATIALHRQNINVLAVDVDAVFLQNPFSQGNGIHEAPNDIAVVSDIAPFTFQYGSKVPINGGFLYFPGVEPVARKFSREVLDKIWEKNCIPKKNEQLVTSSVLRYMSRKYAKNSLYNPHMLPENQYLNFCSTDCGTDQEFSRVLSLKDLTELDQRMSGDPKYMCDANARSLWVYFHAACLNKDNQSKQNVAKAKGMIQSAVYQWVKGK